MTKTMNTPASSPTTTTATAGTGTTAMTTADARDGRAVLRSEARIVWLLDPQALAYVRECWQICPSRSGRPKYYGRGDVVGFAVLKPDAPHIPGVPSAWLRRIFILAKHDRAKQPNGLYRDGLPSEGVDPATVRPGHLGQVTSRAAGFPLPVRRPVGARNEHGDAHDDAHADADRSRDNSRPEDGAPKPANDTGEASRTVYGSFLGLKRCGCKAARAPTDFDRQESSATGKNGPGGVKNEGGGGRLIGRVYPPGGFADGSE